MSLLAVGVSHQTAPVALLEQFAMRHRRPGEGTARAGRERPRERGARARHVQPHRGLRRGREVPRRRDRRQPGARPPGRRDGGGSSRTSPSTTRTRPSPTCSPSRRAWTRWSSARRRCSGQLRAAYALAREEGTVGRALHPVAQRALRVGKRVHTETGIDRAGASLVSVALDRAEERIGSFSTDGRCWWSVPGPWAPWPPRCCVGAQRRSGQLRGLPARDVHHGVALTARKDQEAWQRARETVPAARPAPSSPSTARAEGGESGAANRDTSGRSRARERTPAAARASRPWRGGRRVTRRPYGSCPSSFDARCSWRTRRCAPQVTHRYPSERPDEGHGKVMSNDKAAEAREGLFDSIAGKAKEVAGAVSGKDDLVEEGQLQQAEASNRKAAVADEAIADAKREEAARELRETSREAAEQKGAAQAQAQREESVVERQREQRAGARGARGRARRRPRQARPPSRQADELAESRLREAEAIAADATTTEQRAAAETRPPRARGRRRRPAGRAAARPDREVRTTMISTLIALPYEFARLPLAPRRQPPVRRLPENSGARVLLDRAIGVGRQARRVPCCATRDRPARCRPSRPRRQARHREPARGAGSRPAGAGPRDGRGGSPGGRAEAQGRSGPCRLRSRGGRRRRGARQAGRPGPRPKTAAAKKAAADERAASRTATSRGAQGAAPRPPPRRRSRPPSARPRPSWTRPARPSSPPRRPRADADRLSDLAEAKKQERKQD